MITSERGKITDLDNWTIVAEDIFLVDVGTGAYTEYEVDKGAFKAADIVQLYDEFPGLEDGSKKAHHCHTHHRLGAFMSGTDWSQMNDRALVSNYFMMLVVDSKPPYTWVAHVGWPVVIKQQRKTFSKLELGNKTVSFVNNADGYPDMELALTEAEQKLVGEKAEDVVEEKKVLFVMECNVVKEETDEPALDPFHLRFRHVVQACKEAAAKPAYTASVYRGYSGPINQPAQQQAGSGTGYNHMVPQLPAQAEKKDAVSYGKFDKARLGEDDIKAFLNASVDDELDLRKIRFDSGWPGGKMFKFFRTNGIADLDNYVQNLTTMASEWLDEWYDTSNDTYRKFIVMLKEFLDKHDQLPMAEQIIEAIEQELAVTSYSAPAETSPKAQMTGAERWKEV